MITLEQWSAYLPYKLQMQDTIGNEYTLTIHNMPHAIFNFKPILRPLSALTQDYIYELGYLSLIEIKAAIMTRGLTRSALTRLLADHYNVFNLPRGECMNFSRYYAR